VQHITFSLQIWVLQTLNPHMQKLIIHCCSIVYWPALQCGIKSSRVLKKSGKACCIELVHPAFCLLWFFPDVSKLFLTEVYIVWVTNRGFKDVHLKRIGTKSYSWLLDLQIHVLTNIATDRSKHQLVYFRISYILVKGPTKIFARLSW
jgi:hypothetical protein